ncbi:uncharacterized protein LOC131596228 [Vicia villosa]|uniref:uncharacterized protein LOC131596228 n=1 Tax=Vicia villosa TaxID=3911 RepID=UPI00273AD83C|nr:uncharacterized protein LOC131596228 [Vicia villosa]
MNHYFGNPGMWSSGSSSDDSSDDEDIDEYYWEIRMRSGYIGRLSVLFFPREVCRFFRLISPHIEMCDFDTGEVYECNIRNGVQNREEELYIGGGWYQFARRKRLRRGDQLGFTLSRFPYRLYVQLLNR